jgi:hypothetical protein
MRHGATITRDFNGESPLTIAAYKGREELVNFFVEVPDFSRDDIADAFDLMGCAKLQDNDVDACLSWWKRSMEERNQPGKPVVWKREADRKVCGLGESK